MVEKTVGRLCNAVSLRRGSLAASALSERPVSAAKDGTADVDAAASESDRYE